MQVWPALFQLYSKWAKDIDRDLGLTNIEKRHLHDMHLGQFCMMRTWNILYSGDYKQADPFLVSQITQKGTWQPSHHLKVYTLMYI